MEYLYYLANTSLTLALVDYLHSRSQIRVSFFTVIHLIDGWVVRVKLQRPLNPQDDGDFRAFLNELGISYSPPIQVQMALRSLDSGQSLPSVMRRYQVVIVSHGSPKRSEIETFCHSFVQELGYCPETLA